MAKQSINLNVKDLIEGKPTGSEINGVRIAVVMLQGKVYAINATCTHQGGPLDEGRIDGNCIVCPWHEGRFDISTGIADENTPWVENTKAYTIEVQSDGQLLVDL